MEDLIEVAGLPIYLDGEALILGDAVEGPQVTRRRLADTLKDVWMDPSVGGGNVVYTTYLDVFAPRDKDIFGEKGLQHGYVVVPPGRFGKEFPKQIGHYHPPSPATSLGYPELHMVLHGTAHFILQQSIPPYSAIQDVVVVEASAGDMFCVPPNYGHLVVNPSETTLIFEGFSARGFAAEYEPYLVRRGGAYYEIEGESSGARLVSNSHYIDLPKPRRVLARELRGPAELGGHRSCYEAVVHHPEGFVFLSQPGLYRQEWQLQQA